MALDTVCFCLSKDPKSLAFNHNYISTQRYISHSSKSDSQSTRHNKRITKSLQKNISWIAVISIVIAVSLSNIAYAGKQPSSRFVFSGLSMNLGGPEELSSFAGVLGVPGNYPDDMGALQASIVPPMESQDQSMTLEDMPSDTPVLNVPNASEGYASTESRITRTYTVQEGESLSQIAEKFGISPETIAITNDLNSLDAVKVDTILTILPVDGIKIDLSEDTRSIEELARVYQVSEERIREFNQLSSNSVDVASVIIPEAVVPNTEKPFYRAPAVRVATQAPAAPATTTSVANGYYAYPTTGRNYGVIHSNNGVDVANSCGTPIYASASGVITVSQDGWNGGYGSYIYVSHPNGTQTVYAHLSQRNVQVGQSVAQGELVGLMGTTGRSTGCHLHFEVRGARNPLAR